MMHILSFSIGMQAALCLLLVLLLRRQHRTMRRMLLELQELNTHADNTATTMRQVREIMHDPIQYRKDVRTGKKVLEAIRASFHAYWTTRKSRPSS